MEQCESMKEFSPQFLQTDEYGMNLLNMPLLSIIAIAFVNFP